RSRRPRQADRSKPTRELSLVGNAGTPSGRDRALANGSHRGRHSQKVARPAPAIEAVRRAYPFFRRVWKRLPKNFLDQKSEASRTRMEPHQTGGATNGCVTTAAGLRTASRRARTATCFQTCLRSRRDQA